MKRKTATSGSSPAAATHTRRLGRREPGRALRGEAGGRARGAQRRAASCPALIGAAGPTRSCDSARITACRPARDALYVPTPPTDACLGGASFAGGPSFFSRARSAPAVFRPSVPVHQQQCRARIASSWQSSASRLVRLRRRACACALQPLLGHRASASVAASARADAACALQSATTRWWHKWTPWPSS